MSTFNNYFQNKIYADQPVKEALKKIDQLTNKSTLTLFVINRQEQMVGTLTDGDIRRGLLKGKSIDDPIEKFMHTDYRFIPADNFSVEQIKQFQKDEIGLIPKLDKDRKIVKIINLAERRSLLPMDVIIMAGGKGERLKPLTDHTPKPLLKVGDKPILEHNIDRLIEYGAENFYLSINYLGEQIIDYFQTGQEKGITIHYIKENQPLGTIGAVSLVDNFHHDYALVMNSDILTDIDFEDFFLHFLTNQSDLQVATTTYKVNVPYAVLEVAENTIIAFQEKPTYTYYANAGIYLIKNSLLNLIPKNTFFNATDLIELLIQKKYKITHFPILGYWLDVGKHEDYKKAQEDIHYIKL